MKPLQRASHALGYITSMPSSHDTSRDATPSLVRVFVLCVCPRKPVGQVQGSLVEEKYPDLLTEECKVVKPDKVLKYGTAGENLVLTLTLTQPSRVRSAAVSTLSRSKWRNSPHGQTDLSLQYLTCHSYFEQFVRVKPQIRVAHFDVWCDMPTVTSRGGPSLTPHCLLSRARRM